MENQRARKKLFLTLASLFLIVMIPAGAGAILIDLNDNSFGWIFCITFVLLVAASVSYALALYSFIASRNGSVDKGGPLLEIHD